MIGALYVQRHFEPAMSEFGGAVADFLDIMFAGIHHIPERSLRKVEWKADDYIEVVVRGSWATYDFDELTRLVVLAHDRCIRVQIEAAAPRYYRLVFYRRDREPSQFAQHHPTLEEAVEGIRKSVADYETRRVQQYAER